MSIDQQILEQANASANSPNRSHWRQRLAVTERGFTACFRANPSLFFYFFTTCILVSVASVLGLSGLQWAVLVFAITIAMCSEVLHFCVESIAKELDINAQQNSRQIINMASAAFSLLLAGSVLTIAILLGSRCFELYMQ